MDTKIFLLLLTMISFSTAYATTNPVDPKAEKKNDMEGLIIHSENKKPIKDVNVTAYLLSKKEKAVQSDERGNFGFGDLKPGTYKFVFEKAGYRKVTKEKVVIKADESFQLNIEMFESDHYIIAPSPLQFSGF